MQNILIENSELITLFFTIVVGLSTFVYAILTAKLVKETKLLRKAQTDPEIFISLVHNDVTISFIDLKVENIGFGPAYELDFEVVNDMDLIKRELSNVGFIKNGIKYFSPHQKIQLFVASFIEDPKGLAEKEIELKVNYRNAVGLKFEREFILKFVEYSKFTQVGKPPLYKLSDEVEKMRKSFESVITGFKKLQVDINHQNDGN